MPEGYRLLGAGSYRLLDGAGPYAWDGTAFALMGSGRGGGGAVGGAVLLEGETDGFATDFTYASDSERVAVKTAGTVVSSGLDTFFQNAGTSPKQVFDVSGNLVWSPHNMVLQSENFTASWTVSGTPIVTTHTIQDDDGAAGEYIVTPSIATVIGQNYIVAAWFLKDAVTSRFPALYITSGSSCSTMLNTSTGAIADALAALPLTSAVVDAGTHWKLTITFAAGSSSTLVRLYPAYGTVMGAVGAAAVGTVTVDKVQVNRGSTLTAYLPTTSAARYGLAIDYDLLTHTPLGMLVEHTSTNFCLWASDLTNVAWVKTNATAAKTATGPDEIANSATTITATAANATVLQAITLASAQRISSVYLKRRSGSGNVDITQDNGTTWTAAAVTSAWARYSVPTATILNPTAGIRLATSGDAVDVALFQLEGALAGGISSPFPTFSANGVRAADNVTFLLNTIPAIGVEYSMYARVSTPYPSVNATVAVALTDGTINEQSRFIIATGVLRCIVIDGGTNTASIPGATLTADTFVSAAARFKLDDVGYSTNGAAVGTDTAATLPAVTEVRFASNGANGVSTSAWHIAKLSIVPRAWSDAELPVKSAVT